MASSSSSFVLDNGLNLSDLVTRGSVLHINQDFDEIEHNTDQHDPQIKPVDVFGQPVTNLAALAKTMVAVDDNGYVKKKILEEGGGLALHDGCTVSFAFSGYFEGQLEPYDLITEKKPMVQDLKDNGLLPGLKIALKSMLVGETSVFVLSYKVMYGEMGIPPRIKPKSDCVVYMKLIKSILTPESKIDYSEPNTFQRVNREVKLLFASGSTLFKTNNFTAAIQLFKKGVNMLHRCRLADENEEQIQEKMLKKLYINLAISYIKVNKPLAACTACNELNRLKSLWNNSKVLYNNAKALRMIGQYDEAEKKLLRAIKLSGESDLITAEKELLEKAKQRRNESKVAVEHVKDFAAIELISPEFKAEVDDLIDNFKNSPDNEILLPPNLNSEEMNYIREACVRNNLFCKNILADEANNTVETTSITDKI